MKVVINGRFGGFGLSEKAKELYYELGGNFSFDPNTSLTGRDWYDIDRSDPVLVLVVEELGSEASAAWADLKIVEIPDDVDWIIQDYDGKEWIAEKHRTWR